MQIIQCEKTKKRESQSDICDRHIRLFGESLQDNMSTMTVGIVGAGGLGAILIEQIMRLYPQEIIIIDKDHVELSNLNRLTNATLSDAQNQTPKVEVAKRAVLSNNPNQKVRIINGDFLEIEHQEIYKKCDLIFGALDSIGTRFAINHLAVAHAIPYLDCGTGVIFEENKLKHVGGQVISIMPNSGFCLYCADLFDKKEAMQEFLDNDEHERQEDMGYIRGADIVAPQVYALNMLVASTAVWLFMRIVSGERLDFHGISIDAKEFSLSPWKNKEHDNKNCLICSDEGIAFLGDESELLCKSKPEESSNLNTDIKTEQFRFSYPRLVVGNDNRFVQFFKTIEQI